MFLSIAAAVLMAASPGSGATHSPTQVTRLACSTEPRKLRFGPEGSSIVLDIDAGAAIAWLQLDESGQQMSVSGSAGAGTIRIPQPFRYGQEWTSVRTGDRVTVTRLEPDGAAGGIEATLHCTASPELDRRVAWLRELSEVSARIAAPKSRDEIVAMLPKLDELRASAGDDLSRALAIHLRAQTLGDADESDAAAREFVAAQQAWLAAGAAAQALAARLGAIDAELSAGHRTKVLADTSGMLATIASADYFTVRILNNRCLALDELGRPTESGSCYERLLARLEALDERNEYFTVLKNLADLQRKLGRFDVARKLVLRALGTQGPNAAITRARLQALLAALDSQQGDIASALTHLEASDAELLQARTPALLGRASLRLQEAMLLEQMGSYDEAYAALRAASALIVPTELLATRAKIFSDLEADTRHYRSASFWARIAEETFASSGQTPARDATRLDRMRLLLRLGQTQEVEHAIAENREVLPLYQRQWELLAAELALRQGRLDAAQAALDALRGRELSLRDQLRFAAAEAAYAERTGDMARAQALLLAAARGVADLATRAGNPVMRYLIARQALPLRRRGLGLALDRVDSPDAVGKVWEWLSAESAEPVRSPRSAAATDAAEAFDRAVASELLAGVQAAPEPATTGALISLLGQAKRDGDPVRAPRRTTSLAELQGMLDHDAAFVAFVDGDTRGALLWVTRDGARLVATAAPAQVLDGVAGLNALLQSPGAPIAEVRSAAQQLSARLLGGLENVPVPRRLHVLADDASEAIAWSALPWPGQADPLLMTTDVALVHLGAGGTTARTATLPASRVNVVIAAQQSSTAAALPPLAGAGAEGEQIRAAIGGNPGIVEDAHATRASFLDALARAGGWVHVAAHGIAQSGRIGFAGVWLEPDAEAGTPGFVSWLDILDRGVGADLVVLDACRTGDTDSAIAGNLSFADAMARAGARQVVGASWPVSDASAALWVPAFYQALTADERHDAAPALRAAQQRLRNSRAFTHPFYWAGLQAIERLEPAVPR